MADGDLTSPAAYSEAEVSSYEDTVSSLVQEISDHVQDPSFDSVKILRVLNRGLREMAVTLGTQNVWLPSLATTGEVTARPDALTCRLPANWLGNLHDCTDLTNGHKLSVVDWYSLAVMMADGLPGHLHSVAVNAGVLNYWHNPDNDHRLRLSYYKMPERLALTTRMTAIPPELSSSLLVNYGLFNIYETIETEQNDSKANTKYFHAAYQDGMLTLVRSVGAYPVSIVTPNDVLRASLW